MHRVLPTLNLHSLVAPCRIIGVLDDPDRCGFVYGTLPGHPEQGEESFVVSIDGEDEARFRITAFSQPGEQLTRLAGSIGRPVQRAGTNGYVKALQIFVDQAMHPSPNAGCERPLDGQGLAPRELPHSGTSGSMHELQVDGPNTYGHRLRPISVLEWAGDRS